MKVSVSTGATTASSPLAWLRTMLLPWAVAAAGAAQAQPAGTAAADAARESFRVCDAKAFLALTIARNYMMTGRDRQAVMPHLKDDAQAAAMAETILERIDAGQVRHPGEVAADALIECAAQRRIAVGAPRQHVALCFTRTDIVFFLHVERSDHVIRQTAVSKVQARLSSRTLYPSPLIGTIADLVYGPPELPDLRDLMGRVAWACINRPPSTPAAASR